MGDQMREACGVFGVFAPGLDVARLTFYGLYALQHRGQESAGICTSDDGRLRLRTGMGLVSQVFDEDSLAPLHGKSAIGHTRYSTTGSSRARNAQPLPTSCRVPTASSLWATTATSSTPPRSANPWSVRATSSIPPPTPK